MCIRFSSDPEHLFGLELFGLDSKNLEDDISRLESMGATLQEGPIEMPGIRIAFLKTPGNVRVELIQKVD